MYEKRFQIQAHTSFFFLETHVSTETIFDLGYLIRFQRLWKKWLYGKKQQGRRFRYQTALQTRYTVLLLLKFLNIY
jgi:hypothetical protein